MNARNATSTIGFIGLGRMGQPMASNLVRAGFDVVGYARSQSTSAQAEAFGARIAASPFELARKSAIVLTCLPRSKDLLDILRGRQGLLKGLRRGTVVVDMGTHSPTSARKISERVYRAGGDFLDAPISGGVQAAMKGSLAIMVGGHEAVFDRLLPVFRAMGTTVERVGEVGAGQVAKACNQLIVASTIEAVGEALVLATAAGVDARIVRRVMLGGFASSTVLDIHGERMLERNFDPGGTINLHAKDAAIVRDLARRLGVPLPGFDPVARSLRVLSRAGYGDHDHSALVLALESEAGVEVGRSSRD